MLNFSGTMEVVGINTGGTFLTVFTLNNHSFLFAFNFIYFKHSTTTQWGPLSDLASLCRAISFSFWLPSHPFRRRKPTTLSNPLALENLSATQILLREPWFQLHGLLKTSVALAMTLVGWPYGLHGTPSTTTLTSMEFMYAARSLPPTSISHWSLSMRVCPTMAVLTLCDWSPQHPTTSCWTPALSGGQLSSVYVDNSLLTESRIQEQGWQPPMSESDKLAKAANKTSQKNLIVAIVGLVVASIAALFAALIAALLPHCLQKRDQLRQIPMAQRLEAWEYSRQLNWPCMLCMGFALMTATRISDMQ